MGDGLPFQRTTVLATSPKQTPIVEGGGGGGIFQN